MNPKVRNAIFGAISLLVGMMLFDVIAALFAH